VVSEKSAGGTRKHPSGFFVDFVDGENGMIGRC